MKNILVLQSDFGLSDGAVSAMYGVALSVEKTLTISDITHDIPPFSIWEASYRLFQTVSYWPEGAVFVSVVDPGVGSDRRSIVAQTAAGQYIITPDNGTLTHLKKRTGIVAARIIDETVNRLPRSGESYTFHGRDVYAFTGARLASGVISFEEAGPEISPDSIVELPLEEAVRERNQAAGTIEILDVRFGNLWTNIPRTLFRSMGAEHGDSFQVIIEHQGREVYGGIMKYGRSFADSPVGKPLLYINSLDNLAAAINQRSFASIHKIGTGSDWKITIRKE
ncbi:SAM hydrolase/SAM-dependent halogenase family protein [Bacillus massiliglaciei]|uniref:SAM hydrolase/SAM-dependent halogenase family protein n=1 Tax=Bacillus massiliglaciei TaxID=1816693 RepID=UPI000A5058CA|nr:S-adenosyl-l-methionine hydroxide adenosyltransferase family protein [Bacillus massiliglaciei]